MIVKELFGTKIINASFLFANSNISVKYYSKDFPSVLLTRNCILKKVKKLTPNYTFSGKFLRLKLKRNVALMFTY